MQKDTVFNWSEECQEAMDKLKQHLITAPILAYPDPTKEWYLHCDASNKGLGAVLAQMHDSKEVVIAYASRALTKPELKYHTTEKKCLAVVWTFRLFKSYIQGQRVTVVTDHS